MSERIRQLEDALCDLQSQHSTEPHPLLCEDLLGVKHKDDEPYIPPDKSGTVSHPPEVILSAVETWNYRFSAECVAEVAERTLTAEIPSYATIMELDRKVREFPVPEFPTHVTSSVAGPVPTITTEDLSTSEFMGRFAMAYTREVRKSRSVSAPDKWSHIVTSYGSFALYTSKFLCTGHHRKPCQSTEESIYAVVPRLLSGRFDYTADDRRTVCTIS